MKINPESRCSPRRHAGSHPRSEGKSRSDAEGRIAPSVVEVPVSDGAAMLRIVRPTQGGSIRTLMSGRSWTANANYVSIKCGISMPTEGATALLSAQIDEVVSSIVKRWSEAIRVEYITATGRFCTIIDVIRQKDDGDFQVVEQKASWAGFESDRARRQVHLGRLAADALGAQHVMEVPASLGSQVMRRNCVLIQTYRFVKPSIRAEYQVADLLARYGTVSLGRLADAIAPDPANGMALVCSLMVRRRLAIDLESKVSRDSAVRAVPPLPPHMPGLFDALLRPSASVFDAA